METFSPDGSMWGIISVMRHCQVNPSYCTPSDWLGFNIVFQYIFIVTVKFDSIVLFLRIKCVIMVRMALFFAIFTVDVTADMTLNIEWLFWGVCFQWSFLFSFSFSFTTSSRTPPSVTPLVHFYPLMSIEVDLFDFACRPGRAMLYANANVNCQKLAT